MKRRSRQLGRRLITLHKTVVKKNNMDSSQLKALVIAILLAGNISSSQSPTETFDIEALAMCADSILEISGADD